MWELDHKEGWALKKWCFQIAVLEKTLQSPLDYKKIKAVSLKGNQPWIFTGRTDAKTEAPVLWLPDPRADSLEKNLMLGKIEGKIRRGRQRMTLLDSITDSMDMNLSKLQEIVKDKEACQAVVHEVANSRTWLSNWTTSYIKLPFFWAIVCLLFNPNNHLNELDIVILRLISRSSNLQSCKKPF